MLVPLTQLPTVSADISELSNDPCIHIVVSSPSLINIETSIKIVYAVVIPAALSIDICIYIYETNILSQCR